MSRNRLTPFLERGFTRSHNRPYGYQPRAYLPLSGIWINIGPVCRSFENAVRQCWTDQFLWTRVHDHGVSTVIDAMRWEIRVTNKQGHIVSNDNVPLSDTFPVLADDDEVNRHYRHTVEMAFGEICPKV